ANISMKFRALLDKYRSFIQMRPTSEKNGVCASSYMVILVSGKDDSTDLGKIVAPMPAATSARIMATLEHSHKIYGSCPNSRNVFKTRSCIPVVRSLFRLRNGYSDNAAIPSVPSFDASGQLLGSNATKGSGGRRRTS